MPEVSWKCSPHTLWHLCPIHLVVCGQFVCTMTCSELDSGQCNILLHQEYRLCTMLLIRFRHKPLVYKAALHVLKTARHMHLQHVPAAQGASVSSQWGHTQTLERLLGKPYPGPGHMTRFQYHHWCSHCSSAADLKVCSSLYHHLHNRK